VGISRDYPLKTRTSKQPTGEIPGYKLIPSHPLKYPRSKQGLKVEIKEIAYFQNYRCVAIIARPGTAHAGACIDS
jgi:hypothetical protein